MITSHINTHFFTNQKLRFRILKNCKIVFYFFKIQINIYYLLNIGKTLINKEINKSQYSLTYKWIANNLWEACLKILSI